MATHEQRAAQRITCEFPLRLFNEETSLVARACDVSRTGLRIQVPGGAIGIHRLSSLVQVARRVRALLGDTFTAELHHELLGNLVHKTLRPIRIGQRDWEHADVELGCRMDDLLTDEEAGMLGLALPELGETELPQNLHGVEPVLRRPELPDAAVDSEAAYVVGDALVLGQPSAETSRPERRILLEGREDSDRAPFPVTLDGLTADGAVLRIEDLSALDLDGDVSDVTRFVIALDEAYGTLLTLGVMDGVRAVWRGPVQIRQVEFPPALPGQVALSVAFEQALSENLVREFDVA